MPIGKNSIKRVENNGYTSTVSEAPDMENSREVTLPEKSESTEKKPVKRASTTTAKAKASGGARSAPKTVAKGTANAGKSAAAKTRTATAQTKARTQKKSEAKTDSFGHYGIGEPLPIHML